LRRNRKELSQQKHERPESQSDARAALFEQSLQTSTKGLRFVDYDNDGRKDLLMAQGHVLDTIDEPQAVSK